VSKSARNKQARQAPVNDPVNKNDATGRQFFFNSFSSSVCTIFASPFRFIAE
jgi:hypothetical protein